MVLSYNFSYAETSNLVRLFNSAIYGLKKEIAELENSQDIENRPEFENRIVSLQKEIAGMKAVFKNLLADVREFNKVEGERLAVERKEEAERKKVEREREKAQKAKDKEKAEREKAAKK